LAEPSIGQEPSPNFIRGREGLAPLAVVVHTTAGTFSGTIAWFGNRESRVSSHYLVALDGRVVQFVDEADSARHAGRVLRPTARIVAERSASPNLYTIGIEFEDGGDPNSVDRPDAQYKSGARLIAAAAERWDIPLDRDHVIGHREIFAAKVCPGNLAVERLIEMARSL
jgi:N-acetyl-anhydromuramyl-L-alanine amidase AmpD